MINITVGILTFNRREAVLKAIESAYEQVGIDEYGMEVVVVDAASTDGTAEAIRSQFPEIKLIRLPKNLGCPAGRNHLYANCTGDIIVNVDDDGYLENDTVAKIIETFEMDEKIAVVAFKQCYIGTNYEGVAYSDEIKDINSFRGGISAFRRDALEKVGYYPYDFFLYAEEFYLGLKFIDAGYRIVSRPDAIMWHPKVGTSGGQRRWDFERFKNRMHVVTRLFPRKYFIIYFPKAILSSFKWSMINRTPLQFLRAVFLVFFTLPKTLVQRKPCKEETMKKYFKMEREQRQYRKISQEKSSF
jgi:GT2 family glycosyltransferase